ncbi:hypothetical protein B0T10DRAFT_497909 [Thelonectria olida]|uniref:DUF6593 domain-containing protein n=1 Tax=Thelonectria olida TaxID=1576542 RepID=A0A9P8VSE9_9HYPO|nr:hypothetical protein B0T10DRAFT_497909 [Thelonectria olida]
MTNVPPSGPQTLLIRPSSQNPDFLFVHPDGIPIEAPPMYTIQVNKYQKPHVTVSRGYMSQESIIGYVTMHTFSSTTDISVRGQSMPMKESSLSGYYTLNLPTMGKFKWKPNPFTMSSPELVDSMDQKLAKLSSVSLTAIGQKKLEIMVPVADYFLDFIVVTAYAVRMSLKANKEIASEVGQAVAGI